MADTVVETEKQAPPMEVDKPETEKETATEETLPTDQNVTEDKSEEVKEKKDEEDEDDDVQVSAHQAKSNKNSRYDSRSSRSNYKGRNRGSKYDPSVVPESDDATLIRNQVEFYFGDSNLPTDGNLWDKTGGEENKPVDIKHIHEFGRMRRFQPYEAVVEALRTSKILDVTGPDGSEKVARKVPYNPNRPQNESLPRSIYVKGFGEEFPSTQFDIEAFFAPYGPTNAVRLRRTEDKSFKGSVFVEFADEELAQKFLNLEPKPQYKGAELLVMSKQDYEATRIQEIKDGKREPNSTRIYSSPRGGRYSKGGKDRGDRDPDDWKKRREHDQRNGFRDRKDHGNRQRGRGRGRDRGGRGKDSDRRHNRNEEHSNENDRNGDAQDEPNKKRDREDGDGEEKPAKKVDTKEEVVTEAS